MRYLIIDKEQRIAIKTDLPYATQRIKDELELQNHTVSIAFFKDISIDIHNNKLSITNNGEDIVTYDRILFRGHSLHNPIEYETKQIIVNYIDQHNSTNSDKKIEVQNRNAIKNIVSYDKLYITTLCTINGIPTLDIHYKPNIKDSVEQSHLNYPIIVKHYIGVNDIRLKDGKEVTKKNVYLLNNKEDFKQEYLRDKDINEYFAQKYIDTRADFRIFVSKHNAFAGFKRVATETFITVNKGEYTKIDNNEYTEIFEVAQKVSKVVDADFIAVDMMEENGKPVLIEISLNPGFKAFETKSDGQFINIAKIIADSF